MKKAFFAYQYGMANAGDFAINIGSLDLLSNFFEEIVIVSKLTSDDPDFENNVKYLNKYYPNLQVIEGPFKLNRGNALRTLKSYALGALKYPYLLKKGIYNEKIKDSDMLFLNGGNLLRCESLTDYVRLYALLFPLRLARKNNIDYILLPQSTTSIDNKGKKILEPFLNQAKLVLAREEITYKKLTKSFKKANIVNSLDSAFFIKDREIVRKEYKEKYYTLIKKDKNVCITLRKEDLGDIGELSDDKKERIIMTIKDLVIKLLENKYSITFVIQTKKDKNFTYNIYNNFKSNPEIMVIEEYDPLILREIYRNSICLFGMRLHSLILAMSVGTPVVGYFDQNWGVKNPGTLGKYGMPYGYINDELELYSLLQKALNNKDRMIMEIEESKKETLELIRNEVLR